MRPIVGHLSCAEAIPWHQDLPYWKASCSRFVSLNNRCLSLLDGWAAGLPSEVDGDQIGSVWIALDDMPLEASVRYLRGSHARGSAASDGFCSVRNI